MNKIAELLKKLFAGDPEKSKMLEGLDFGDDSSKIEELTKIINDLKSQLPNFKEPEKKSDDPSNVTQVIAGLTDTVKNLQESIVKEAQARELAEKRVKDDALALQKKKIDDAIQKAIESEKIAPKAEDDINRWREAFEQNYEIAEFSLSKVKGKDVKPGGKPGMNPQTGASGDSAPSSALGTSVKPSIMEYVNKSLPTN